MIEAILAWKADLQVLLFIALALAAWRWGGSVEKACAVALCLQVPADRILHLVEGTGANFLSLELEYFVLDSVLAAALVALALTANRIYPLWLAAIQLVAVTTHFSAALAQTAPLAYSIMAIAPSYLEILVLGLGIAVHRSRTRRHGPVRSWRPGFEAWLARRQERPPPR